MLKNLKQQSGFSLIGILVAVVIIAALAYGSSFFWSKKTKDSGVNYKNTQDQFDNLQKQIEESNKLKLEALGETGEKEEISSIEDWRVYEKLEMNVRLTYHKDWYYDRDEQAEKELGYDLYVGFAESLEILDQGRFYPIEFIIVDKDYEFSQYYSGYVKVIAVKDGKKYVLKTEDSLGYSDIIDKMVESFEFLKK